MNFCKPLLIPNLMFILALLNTSGAQGFINIESIRQIGGEGLVGRTGLQVNGQEGNTNKFTSQFSLLTAYRIANNEWLFTGDYKYGESFHTKDTNLGSAHLRHTWGYKDPIAYEAFIQTGFNEFQELNSRSYFGGNLRFRLSASDESKLFLGTGSFYEVEDFESDKDRKGMRGNLYLSYLKKIDDLISGSAILYYQPFFEYIKEYRIRAQLGIDITLTKSLILDIDLNLSHNTGLPPGVKQTDTDYLTGITVKF